MEDKYYLINQSECWADEFDTEGFFIKSISGSDFEKYLGLGLGLDNRKVLIQDRIDDKLDGISTSQFNKIKDILKKYYDANLHNIPLTYQNLFNKIFDEASVKRQYELYETIGYITAYLSDNSEYSDIVDIIFPRNNELYFGTNEYHIFSSFDEYINTFTIQEITKNEYDVISKLIGNSFGIVV